MALIVAGSIGQAFAQAAEATGSVTTGALTTNARTNPLGIAGDDVSFGWAAASGERGVVQAAYELRVGTSPGTGDVWHSGVVRSDRQVDVRLPAGVRLAPATRYWWQVRIQAGNGNAGEWSEPAWFETGLLSERDWKGAEWITRPAGSVNMEEWTDYSLAVEFTLHHEAFGVFLRTTPDARDGYMFQLNVTGDTPVLKTHKKADGSYQETDRVDLSNEGFTNESIRESRHTLVFEVRGSTVVTKLDGKEIGTHTDVSFRKGLVGFRTHGRESATVHRVKVSDAGSGRVLMAPDFGRGESGFTGGTVTGGAYHISGDTEAVFTGAPSSLPLLRGVFHAREKPQSARLYASASGIYEASINGRKAGDQFLAPGWTDYDTRIQSQTYDITGLVQPGANVIGAALADGWFRGSVGLNWTHVYGSQLAFVAKIQLTYADGSTEWFASGSDWQAGDGPFVRADLQDGENYDATREQPGWDTPDFDASAWKPVEVVANDSAKLVPQPDEPVRAKTILTATGRTEISPGTWIYDLGQNMVGVARVTMKGKKGQTVTLRHAEELYRTGPRAGRIYTENLRSAWATDTFTFADDGTITYQPTFTQHGFRYVEITGTDSPPDVTGVKGVVLSSDLPDTGDLVTSNAMLNQLVSNIRWGQRSNFLSIPTDTPARDERLGWTGDINVFAPAACRYQDTRAFLSKWMTDVRDEQKSNGNLPAVVPQPRNAFDETGVGWSDAVITIPYQVWQAYGDERIIRENWDAMKAFYQFVHDSATRDGDLLEQGRSCWFSGDWLSLEKDWNRLEEHKVIATAYFAENTRMMAEMAEVMGEPAFAARWSTLAPRIRAAFAEAYRGPDGSIYQGTQTAYALALGMDMIADPSQREQTAARFIETLASDSHHLQTGFLGTPWLLPALSGIGREDLAMRLLLNEDYPSWGFPISMGATTMWERWNSIQPGGEFGPVDMNSFNHYAYGAVGDWMFAKIGGLQQIEPGYKKSRIAPLVGAGGLTSAKATQRTPFGTLSCEWRLDAGKLTLRVEIPANTAAELFIPTADLDKVLEGGRPARGAPGVGSVAVENQICKLGLGSGTYEFSVRN